MKTNLPPGLQQRRGFTLVEMLVVMGVIAVLAAMIFPAAAAIKRRAAISRATTELKLVATAIDAYKANFNHYPPDNPNSVEVPQLYYELVGTTNVGSGNYLPEGGASMINPAGFFGVAVAGFVNVSKGGGDEAQRARNHLPGLKPNQYLEITNGSASSGIVLGTTTKGPVLVFDAAGNGFNPWRYVSTRPTNNPASYDLWIDISVGGKTLRISNWREIPETVTP